ncbi:DegT/DnrJ/EryC1/StrS family aminotransferase [uncultured Dysgonomonas sp.]|uniref:dTDP-4-amino-4,6-dideoxy-D-glucose transaminase n=1 Tax=uncultured Dysgonomonas sp. TaxID=206096 RepID=A0A212K0L2_9BACT|nr:DegT/DnrJ/EryC1/StrS family aminotransferase [uncultured Dysgonomonas sp.]SBW05300.1 dTDP-4-amino-4,6-dideoxy-D-glucose transaminase [uncultured Dysgonomonas sp.]
MSKQIFVTQPALPPLEEFIPYLQQIWDNKILTNNGPFHQQFEQELADYLGVKYISVFSNGTLALITALQALRITGEVITTPFSFVATTHSLWWNNIKPVFVDIDDKYYNIDPAKIEAAITPQTTAIMPVHVYGNPCNVEEIQRIADIYGLRVIYDAAHAFSVKKDGQSVMNWGDLSILSFHATKVYNTIEGGAIVCQDEKTKQRIDLLKNFGFRNETTVIEPGINAKMNELQAAYGSLQLKYVDSYIAKRLELAKLYDSLLKDIPGVSYMEVAEGVQHTYPYYPVRINTAEYGMNRDELYFKLQEYDIFGRRYFYPLISDFPTYKGLPSASVANLPIAGQVSKEIVCLPIYANLEFDEVRRICDLIKNKPWKK